MRGGVLLCSPLPGPAGGVCQLANFSTCWFVGFSTCREVGELESWRGASGAQGGGEKVLQGADTGWRIQGGGFSRDTGSPAAGWLVGW